MTSPSRNARGPATLALAAALLTPLVASAQGAAPSNLVYVPLTPCRVINTGLVGGPLIAGTPRTFLFRGPTQNYSTLQGGNAAGCGIPGLSTVANAANLAKAVAVNIFAVSPVSDGDIRAWPSNQGVPLAAVLTYSHVGTLAFANGTILTMCDQAQPSPCSSGDITFRADFANTNLIVDVVGYFTEASTLGSNANLALGHSALSSNALGTSNTAVGSLALQLNTDGTSNSAIGASALQANTTGNSNTALGAQALAANTASQNTAIGASALKHNTAGVSNTAVGSYALFTNTAASANSAFGQSALANSSGGGNTGIGFGALASLSYGYRNVAVGYKAGYALNQSDNIDIGNTGVLGDNGIIRIGATGTHVEAFIAGINGVVISGGVPVLINSSGQLGTITSSRRFKENIRDLGDVSARILDLRPVSFRYKAEFVDGDRPTEFGLIAEEVEKTFPELVVYGKDGLPQTVKYHLLVPLLLNELQKDHAELLNDRAELAEQRRVTSDLERRLRALQAAVALRDAPLAPSPVP